MKTRALTVIVVSAALASCSGCALPTFPFASMQHVDAEVGGFHIPKTHWRTPGPDEIGMNRAMFSRTASDDAPSDVPVDPEDPSVATLNGIEAAPAPEENDAGQSSGMPLRTPSPASPDSRTGESKVQREARMPSIRPSINR